MNESDFDHAVTEVYLDVLDERLAPTRERAGPDVVHLFHPEGTSVLPVPTHETLTDSRTRRLVQQVVVESGAFAAIVVQEWKLGGRENGADHVTREVDAVSVCGLWPALAVDTWWLVERVRKAPVPRFVPLPEMVVEQMKPQMDWLRPALAANVRQG